MSKFIFDIIVFFKKSKQKEGDSNTAHDTDHVTDQVPHMIPPKLPPNYPFIFCVGGRFKPIHDAIHDTIHDTFIFCVGGGIRTPTSLVLETNMLPITPHLL